MRKKYSKRLKTKIKRKSFRRKYSKSKYNRKYNRKNKNKSLRRKYSKRKYNRKKRKNTLKVEKRRKFSLILLLTHLESGSKKLTFNFLSRILVYLYDHQLFHLC